MVSKKAPSFSDTRHYLCRFCKDTGMVYILDGKVECPFCTKPASIPVVMQPRKVGRKFKD